MNSYLELKNNFCALKASNNFGDQIIVIVDLTGQDEVKDPDIKYYAGAVVYKEVNHEGSHEPFTVTRLNKLIPRRNQKETK